MAHASTPSCVKPSGGAMRAQTAGMNLTETETGTGSSAHCSHPERSSARSNPLTCFTAPSSMSSAFNTRQIVSNVPLPRCSNARTVPPPIDASRQPARIASSPGRRPTSMRLASMKRPSALRSGDPSPGPRLAGRSPFRTFMLMLLPVAGARMAAETIRRRHGTVAFPGGHHDRSCSACFRRAGFAHPRRMPLPGIPPHRGPRQAPRRGSVATQAFRGAWGSSCTAQSIRPMSRGQPHRSGIVTPPGPRSLARDQGRGS
jgi:hypothetical protein